MKSFGLFVEVAYALDASAVVWPVDLFVAEAECLVSNQLFGPRL